MQSLTQKSLSVFEKSRKQIVSDGQSFVTAPKNLWSFRNSSDALCVTWESPLVNIRQYCKQTRKIECVVGSVGRVNG